MKTDRNDPTGRSRLIEANHAFFNGDRAETRRLLAEYRQTPFANFEQMQWLQAHAQDEYNYMLQDLRLLVLQGEPDSPYVIMAQNYLAQEDDLQLKIAPPAPPQNRRLQALGIATLVAVVLFVMFLFLNDGESGQSALVDASATVEPLSITQAIVQRVDRSQALFGDTYTARYDSGLLQVTAIEDRSERVVDRNSMLPLTPVLGARFVALSLLFECRSGICRQPPEADVFLRLSEGELMPHRSDIMIDGAETLRPVALGRTSEGWLIFEIPALSRPEALVIRTFATESGTRIPDIEIALPLF